MRQPKIDRDAAHRLEDNLNAAVQKALDSIRFDVTHFEGETPTNRSDSTSE